MTRQRSSLIIAAALTLGCICVSGCARSAASKWAELSPAIRPLPASETTVLLGVTDHREVEPVADPDDTSSSQ